MDTPVTAMSMDSSSATLPKKVGRKRRQIVVPNLKIKKTANGMLLSKMKADDDKPVATDDPLRKRKYWRAGIYSSTFKEDM